MIKELMKVSYDNDEVISTEIDFELSTLIKRLMSNDFKKNEEELKEIFKGLEIDLDRVIEIEFSKV